MTEPICVFKLVVHSSVVDCQKESCQLWEPVLEKCNLVSQAYWAKIDHAQARSNIKGK